MLDPDPFLMNRILSVGQKLQTVSVNIGTFAAHTGSNYSILWPFISFYLVLFFLIQVAIGAVR
jgi:hypothetical protein